MLLLIRLLLVLSITHVNLALVSLYYTVSNYIKWLCMLILRMAFKRYSKSNTSNNIQEYCIASGEAKEKIKSGNKICGSQCAIYICHWMVEVFIIKRRAFSFTAKSMRLIWYFICITRNNLGSIFLFWV